jgi:hypothetical protein
METKDLGLMLTDGFTDSKGAAEMIDEIRERFIKMELIVNDSKEWDSIIDGTKTLDRMDFLKSLRDGFLADAQKIKSDVA